MAQAQTANWPEDVFARLKEHGVSTVATVPDFGLTRLLDQCREDGGIRVVTLATEEEGVGITYGAWLGGDRAVLCMQSSGVGNCINALALPAFHRTPCLMLVTMRGQEGEGNPAQFPMGRAVVPVLEAMGVTCLEANKNSEAGARFHEAAGLAFNEDRAVAVIVAQSVIGAKTFGK